MWQPIHWRLIIPRSERKNPLETAVLQELFKQINQKYFDGKLPPYRVHIVKSLSNHAHVDGRCFVRWKIIAISQYVPDGCEEELLIHECIHAYLGRGGHGKRFHQVVEKIMRAQGPIQPTMRWRTPWLKDLPLCYAWAREEGVMDRKTRRRRALYQSIEIGVADLDIRDFDSAMRQAAFESGIDFKSLPNYVSMRKLRRVFDEFGGNEKTDAAPAAVEDELLSDIPQEEAVL